MLGLAHNQRLARALGLEMQEARSVYRRTGEPARRFGDFTYRTRKSWSRKRRVVGKAEHLSKGENPRFVVTSLSPRQATARRLYEKLYCGRGEMENRIKEQQLDLFADCPVSLRARGLTKKLIVVPLRSSCARIAQSMTSWPSRVGNRAHTRITKPSYGGKRFSSFRYIDEISVTQKKRLTKSGIGDTCGLNDGK